MSAASQVGPHAARPNAFVRMLPRLMAAPAGHQASNHRMKHT